MAPIARFSQRIRARSSQIENAGTRIVKMMSLRALKSLVYATPVDVGTARSNWTVGLGNPTSAKLDAYAPGKNLGRGERANARAAISAGRSKIESISPGRGNRLKMAVYISNNCGYIKDLNDGRSPQSPKGFVDDALQDARSVISNFKVFSTSRSDDEGGDF